MISDREFYKQIRKPQVHQERKEKEITETILDVALIVLIMCIFSIIIFFCTKSYSYQDIMKPVDIIHATIGEAANQSLEGQIAVVCAIKNRGSLRGVYGSLMTRMPSNKEIAKAQQAYILATPQICEELIHGADHWENVEEFGYPDWADSMTRITKIGDHTFYKE